MPLYEGRYERDARFCCLRDLIVVERRLGEEEGQLKRDWRSGQELRLAHHPLHLKLHERGTIDAVHAMEV